MKMSSSSSRTTFITALVVAIFGFSNAEESSILLGATMSDYDIKTPNAYPKLSNSVIAGNYKLRTATDDGNNNSGMKEVAIDMLRSQ